MSNNKVEQVLVWAAGGIALLTLVLSFILYSPTYLQVFSILYLASLIFLIPTLYVTVWSRKYDPEPSYGHKVTVLGVTLFLSPLAKKTLDPETIFECLYGTCQFWAKIEEIDVKEVLAMISGTEVVTKDQEYILLDDGRKAAGYCYCSIKKIGIATLDKGALTSRLSRLTDLLTHETSHIIVYNLIGPIDPHEEEEKTHHELFKEVELGC